MRGFSQGKIREDISNGAVEDIRVEREESSERRCEEKFRSIKNILTSHPNRLEAQGVRSYRDKRHIVRVEESFEKSLGERR